VDGLLVKAAWIVEEVLMDVVPPLQAGSATRRTKTTPSQQLNAGLLHVLSMDAGNVAAGASNPLRRAPRVPLNPISSED
jgi:hypothetical protein